MLLAFRPLDGARPPEFTRMRSMSVAAAVVSPVQLPEVEAAQFASARSRINSSLRMIGIDESLFG